MGTARRIGKKMREKYFEKLQNLPMAFFNDSDGGDLMTRGVNDIENIKMACGFGIVLVYDGIVLLAFIFISMFIISPEFTLYAAIPFVLMGFLILRYGDYIQKLTAGTSIGFGYYSSDNLFNLAIQDLGAAGQSTSISFSKVIL